MAAFLCASATAFAQGAPPPAQPPPAQPAPPADAPPPADSPIPPAYTQTDAQAAPAPAGNRCPGDMQLCSDGSCVQRNEACRTPPPGPGYGPPPDPYNYGVPPGTPYAGDVDDWEEGDPIPPGYQPDTRIRKGLVIGGAVTMGALWVISIIIGGAAVSVEEADEELGGDSNGLAPEDFYPLFIPVAGPFIALVTTEAEGVGTAFLIIDGVGQAGGLAMLIAGLAAQQTYLRRVHQYGEVNVEFAPVVTPEFAGMGLKGSF
jgi:hypothetical protein